MVGRTGNSKSLPEDPAYIPLHEMFHRQAARTPSATAVVDDSRSLTYEELNLRVLLLAEHLRTNFGVGLDSSVGIYMDPSVNYVISLMGAMSAGGCFVTIDSSFPLKKIVDLVEDSKSKVILTTRSLSTRLKGLDDVPVFIVDDNYDTVFALLDNSGHTVETLEAKRLAAPRANLDNLAFIVYTSGTTGKPKELRILIVPPFYRISGAGPYRIVVTAIELHNVFLSGRQFALYYGVQQHTVCRTRLSIIPMEVIVCESTSNY